MQKLGFIFVLTALLTTGCVYRIDIPQGTPLTHAQASQVKVGMTAQQVRYLLGSPTVTDTLNPNRWDYIYNYIPGTYAKKAKIPAARNQHLKIYFDQNGIVSQIQGLESIPTEQPGLPASKMAILNVE